LRSPDEQVKYLFSAFSLAETLNFNTPFDPDVKSALVPIKSFFAARSKHINMFDLRVYVYLCMIAQQTNSCLITLKAKNIEAIANKLKLSKTAFKLSILSLQESEYGLIEQIDKNTYKVTPLS